MRLGALHLMRFPLQRKVGETPSLKGRPFVLFEELKGVQRVAFASGAALKRGVRPGQTVASAAALVPGLQKFVYRPDDEARALGCLGEALLMLAPGFEIDPPEGLWLDASAAPLSGGESAWLARAVSLCASLGLHAKGAVASERFTAQALARFSEGQWVVGPRAAFELAPLPLHALGVLGPGAAAPFASLGLSTLGEVAGLSAGAVSARYGGSGLTAARWCRGEDDTPFTPDPLPQVLEETITLDWPAESLEPLLFGLKTLLDRLCARLQGRQQAAVRLVLTLKLDPAGSMTVPLVLARPSNEARLLLELCRHRLTELSVERPIASLHLLVEEASGEVGRQLVLGDEPAGDAALEIVLSRLASALGESALLSAELEARHRPETAWRAGPFRPPAAVSGLAADTWTVREGPATWPGADHGAGQDGRADPAGSPSAERSAPGAGGQGAAASEEGPAAAPVGSSSGAQRAAAHQRSGVLGPAVAPALLERPARLLPQPAALQAELDARGQLTAARVLGRRRKVTAVYGPERLCGEWWSPLPFARDYFRVCFEEVGALWVFRDERDGELYVQGVFD